MKSRDEGFILALVLASTGSLLDGDVALFALHYVESLRDWPKDAS